MGARDYQSRALAAVSKEHESVQSTLVCSPTGTGKTVMFCIAAKQVVDRGGRVMVLVDRTELVHQTYKSMEQWTGITPDVEQADLAASTSEYFAAPIVVATVQTMRSRGGTRKERFDPKEFDLLIVDECFAAGTLVDGKPIESYVPGDMVNTRLPDGSVDRRRVVRRFKKKPSAMVTISLSCGSSVSCTPNHPVWSGDRWVKAGDLRIGHPVMVRCNHEESKMHPLRKRVPVQIPTEDLRTGVFVGEEVGAQEAGYQSLPRVRGEVLPQVQKDLLPCVRLQAEGDWNSRVQHFGGGQGVEEGEEQPNGKGRCQAEGVRHDEKDWPQAEDSRWQRAWSDQSRKSTVGRIGLAAYSHIADGTSQAERFSKPLQAGCGLKGKHACYRDRRELPLELEGSGCGQEEGGFLAISRVESVEVHERGGDGRFGGVCKDGYVYNLEVEDGQTYFANGVLAHNCHLSISPTTIKTIEWFKSNKDLKVIGFTATPKRDDNRSLGILYDSCAFQYTISQATKDGWLVPCIGRIIHIPELSLAKLPGGKRDWTAAEIGRYMEVNDVVLKTAQATIDLTAGKQSLVFCARVSQAEAVAKRINFIEPDSAAVIHGKTPADERRQIINDFNAKRIKRIINCGVLTTGFDSPGVECIVNARPTKSWALFTQIVGRALRPLPGVVDKYDTPEERRAAIAASDKPRAEIISLVGREENMDLAGPVDVLAGDDDRPEVVARAKEIMEQGEESPEDALIKAEEEIDREMRRLQDLENAPIRVHANYEEEEANLYEKGEFRAAQAGSVDIPVQREVAFLISAGFTPQEMRGWSGEIVRQAIEVVKARYVNGLASKKQCNVLAKIGIPESRRRNMTSKEANVIIGRTFSRR